MKSLLLRSLVLASLATAGAIFSDSPTAEAQVPPGIGADDARVRAHVMRPPHVEGIHTDRGLEEVTAPIAARHIVAGPVAPHLNVEKFGKALHASLKDSVAGYAMQLRRHGVPTWTLIWNWAQTPANGGAGWTLDTHQHIASVSKLVTGIGMTKLLDAKNISYDAKIIDYLPTYWKKGPNIDKVTFRNLMTQTSGFVTGTSSSDYEFMKQRVEMGSTDHGHYHYENMNFGLCRILMSVINGNIAKSAVYPGFIGDQIWDYVTINGYHQYLQNHVFAPSGVTGATLTHPGNDALAYTFPPIGSGWNSGDLSSVSGGAGWHMSVNELLNVMGTFRRKGTIMSTAKAQSMLDNTFGLDVRMSTPAGTLYNKNGAWGDSAGHEEQALAYFLPEDMEMVLLTNSPVGLPGKFFRGVVTDLYMANIE